MDKLIFFVANCFVMKAPNFNIGGSLWDAILPRRIPPPRQPSPPPLPPRQPSPVRRRSPPRNPGPSAADLKRIRDAEEEARKEKRERKKEEKLRKEAEQQHKKEMKEMKDQLKDQKDEIKNLMQKLENLMIQFSESRKNFFDYVHEKPKNDIAVRENLKEVLQKAKDVLKLDTRNYYNFAVIGHVKTGKSSIINALRGIGDDEPGAAKVGITETTQTIQMYSLDKNVRIYDIPGAGTLTHNADSYFRDKCLCAFDCLIICIQETLGEEEINFAVQALKFTQPIVFIRSRCDVVLDTAKKARKIRKIDQSAVSKYINEMNDSYLNEVQKVPALSDIPCFFISAFTLCDLIKGEEPEAIYQEQAFLDYIKTQSKCSRNIQF